ncbi:MAG TPA: EAL domain-containing protein [Thermoanaerobaculia bacterium]|nr:EAL domain-containing protein [Thermoanaerobaculia bacterium]
MSLSPALSIQRVPLLNDVIASGNLIPHFQPIVSISEPKQILGFESLMRYRCESIFSNPATLFEYALRKGSIVELDAACVERSFLYGTALADPQLLFVNIRPELLSRPNLIFRTVTEAARWCDLPLSNVVLEITEDAAVSDRHEAIENLDRLHEAGVRFAIDDVGIAHSHLNLIDHIAPAFLKISHEFGHDFELDETKIRIVRNIVALARDFSAEVILEGIETEQTLRAAESLGIRRGQGYLFSRPLPLADALALAHHPPRVLVNDIQAAAALR